MRLRQRHEKGAVLLLTIISACLMAGCVVHSVSPFYDDKALTDVPDIHGKWVLKKSELKEGLNSEWTFTVRNIVAPGNKGFPATLSSRFFRIDDMLFLDAIADDPPEGLSFWWVLHITPVHTVSRVIAEGRTMKIIPLNDDWMEEAVKSREVTLPFVRHQEQNANLFTASAAEWMAFLKKYGKDPNVFSEKAALYFERQ